MAGLWLRGRRPLSLLLSTEGVSFRPVARGGVPVVEQPDRVWLSGVGGESDRCRLSAASRRVLLARREHRVQRRASAALRAVLRGDMALRAAGRVGDARRGADGARVHLRLVSAEGLSRMGHRDGSLVAGRAVVRRIIRTDPLVALCDRAELRARTSNAGGTLSSRVHHAVTRGGVWRVEGEWDKGTRGQGDKGTRQSVRHIRPPIPLSPCPLVLFDPARARNRSRFPAGFGSASARLGIEDAQLASGRRGRA